MTKMSKHYRSYRELMVGANQYGSNAEWTSELQTEHFVSVGFGECVPALLGHDVIDILKMGQVKAKQSAQQLISEVRKAMGLQMI
jgi:hypothetical protein